MVKLRLMRMGRKRLPSFRIVAVDSRVKRDGKYIALLGNMNPIDGKFVIDEELVLEWLNKGAKPTDTVKNILSQHGIWSKFMLSKVKKASKESK
ncbi:30S ribosomal protein S16 [Mycoplasmoides alvi]|uniref:30S ribosomal protein S16 n=1 Tax=Mycoplasmoides alvi TaxID=78580 RepID=UPI0012EB92A5|nr:30S ribosomal protein S16 [Mycoplasmoides alvi]